MQVSTLIITDFCNFDLLLQLCALTCPTSTCCANGTPSPPLIEQGGWVQTSQLTGVDCSKHWAGLVSWSFGGGLPAYISLGL